jgi:hypothetical protein
MSKSTKSKAEKIASAKRDSLLELLKMEGAKI